MLSHLTSFIQFLCTQLQQKQESIPVGCVLSTCQPYVFQCPTLGVSTGTAGLGGYTYPMMHTHPPHAPSLQVQVQGEGWVYLSYDTYPHPTPWHIHPHLSLWETHHLPLAYPPLLWHTHLPGSRLGYLPQHTNSQLVPTHMGPSIPTPLPCGQTDTGL